MQRRVAEGIVSMGSYGGDPWDLGGGHGTWAEPRAPMHLASGAKWADVQVDCSDTLYVAQADISNYFYHLAIPPELAKYFCLPPVPA